MQYFSKVLRFREATRKEIGCREIQEKTSIRIFLVRKTEEPCVTAYISVWKKMRDVNAFMYGGKA